MIISKTIGYQFPVRFMTILNVQFDRLTNIIIWLLSTKLLLLCPYAKHHFRGSLIFVGDIERSTFPFTCINYNVINLKVYIKEGK